MRGMENEGWNMFKTIARGMTVAFRGILCFFTLAITGVSVLFTVTTDYAESDFMMGVQQGFFVAALLLCCLISLPRLARFLAEVPRPVLLSFIAVYALALSLAWIYAAKATQGFDSLDLINASELDATSGWWSHAGYIERYPFQVPFTLVLSGLRGLFGAGVDVAFQVVNCLAISVTAMLIVMLSEQIAPAHMGAVRAAAVVLVAVFPPLYLYATFVYGNLISLPFALGAFSVQIHGFRTSRMRFHVLSAVLAVVAVLLKSSMLLVLVALSVVWLVGALKHRGALLLLCIPLVLTLNSLSSAVILTVVGERMGTDLNNGLPQTAWVVMGIGADASPENELSLEKPGWYSGYPWARTAETYDVQDISREATELIKDRIGTFLENPTFALKFFAKKFAYEWAEPTFESIVSSNWAIAEPGGTPMASRHVGALASSVYYGLGNHMLIGVCDVMQSVLFCAALIFFWSYRDRFPIELMAPALFAAGGGLFYLFWEAKSQYMLPFALILIPYAASGLAAISGRDDSSGLQPTRAKESRL